MFYGQSYKPENGNGNCLQDKEGKQRSGKGVDEEEAASLTIVSLAPAFLDLFISVSGIRPTASDRNSAQWKKWHLRFIFIFFNFVSQSIGSVKL